MEQHLEAHTGAVLCLNLTEGAEQVTYLQAVPLHYGNYRRLKGAVEHGHPWSSGSGGLGWGHVPAGGEAVSPAEKNVCEYVSPERQTDAQVNLDSSVQN